MGISTNGSKYQAFCPKDGWHATYNTKQRAIEKLKLHRDRKHGEGQKLDWW